MYKFAIHRPITTAMIFISLIVFGMMSFKKMPVSLFPNIDLPMVTITTTSFGANPEAIESKVTDKIEEAVATIDGLEKIMSTSSENISVVRLQFDLGKDINEATNDVRDKVSKIAFGREIDKPLVSKLDVGGASIIGLFVASNENNPNTLMQTVDDIIKPTFERLPGVGAIKVVGYRERQIRIYPDAFLLNKYHISITQLQQLIASQNIKQSGGKLVSKTEEIVVTIKGDASTVAELENMKLAQGIRLKDVAKVVDDLEDIKDASSLNGIPGVILEVQKISGENTVDIIKAVKAQLPALLKRLGDNYTIETINDTSQFIIASIDNVKFDLVYGSILAIIIVFLFLRNVTATLVSAVAIPTSIIGTFAVMDWLGFELNKMTLIGLTLAIGIFIDDAIVVIENIYKKLEKGLDSFQAAFEGVKEIAFSILAISAMLLAVFVPVAFMGGIVGQFFYSFAMTVASGVMISYFVAILLIPTLGARLLKAGESRFYHMTEPYFAALDRFYVKVVRFSVTHRIKTILIAFSILVFSGSLASKIGKDFVPVEDRNAFQVTIKAPVGTSIEQMKLNTKPLEDTLRKHPFVKYISNSIAYNSAQESHKAQIYVQLVDIKDRDRTEVELIAYFRKAFGSVKTMEVNVSPIPTIKGAGADMPFQMILAGDDLNALEKASKKVMMMLAENEGIVDITSNFEGGKPQYDIIINRNSAVQYGVSVKDISTAINAALSSDRAIAKFSEGGKEYDITLRFSNENRLDITSLKRIQIPSQRGEPIFLEGLIDFEKSFGPVSINRYNRQRQITIMANLTGIALGAAVAHNEAHIQEFIDDSISYRYIGKAEEMKKSNAAFGMAFGLTFLLMFLILAALYESVIQPVIIMVALPLSFVGVFLALFLSGQPFGLFTMIGIMLLLGMVGKNAVLLVDFANQELRRGLDTTQALVEAGEKRLRPILMTTFAMVFAMMPLAMGNAAGHESNAPMATAIIGGLVSSMLLTLLVVPAIYKLLAPVDLFLRKFYDQDFTR